VSNQPITATEVIERNNSFGRWIDEIFREAERLGAMELVIFGNGTHVIIPNSNEPPRFVETNNPLTDKLNALLAEFSPRNPPPWIRIREMIEMGLSGIGAAALLDVFGMDPMEPSSPLRPEVDPDDSLGAETDSDLGMGDAESWFRAHSG